MIRRAAEEKRFPVAPPPVIDGQRLASINSHANFGSGMIGILSGLRQHVDDQLRDRYRSLNALHRGIVRLGHHRVKALIVKID
jgi:hypothetical protein